MHSYMGMMVGTLTSNLSFCLWFMGSDKIACVYSAAHRLSDEQLLQPL